MSGDGEVQLLSVVTKAKYSFLDYIKGGCEIGFHIGIDFTKSNGLYDQPDSLHNKDESKNGYIKAIKSIGSIL